MFCFQCLRSSTIQFENGYTFYKNIEIIFSLANYTLEGAYGLDFYDQRVIASNTANPSYNGTYDLTVHLFSLSYKYSFWGFLVCGVVEEQGFPWICLGGQLQN